MTEKFMKIWTVICEQSHRSLFIN